MTEDELINEAYEWAYQRAKEEGDVDIDRDYDIIERWGDEYIRWYLSEVK